jgi:NAD(P)-dependent dehydrogenase (short-subunit alcohol dehydrogenase family)
MLLKDKVIVITGVGPGMGRKLALIGAAEGAKLAIAARSEGFINEVAKEITDSGGEAIAIATDVCDKAQCENLAAGALATFGRIDGLINSAFRYRGGQKLEESPIEEWEATLDVTLLGTIRMVKAVLPAMKARREGSIVNVSTRSSVEPLAGEGPYVTAKTALHGLTRQLAVELGPFNIRVNAPRMGWLWGVPVQHHLRAMAEAKGISEQEIIDGIARDIPLGLIPPDDECAKSVLFFLSDYARMVTGTSLDINGGQFMAP